MNYHHFPDVDAIENKKFLTIITLADMIAHMMTITNWDRISLESPAIESLSSRINIDLATFKDLKQPVAAELAKARSFLKITYHNMKEERVDLGDGIILTTKYLNHPILCLGYRFECRGRIFCTAYDTEPFQNIFCTDPEDPSYDETMASEGEWVARRFSLPGKVCRSNCKYGY